MKEHNVYLHRGELNEEICTLKNYMGWDKAFNCILIVSEIKNEDMTEKDVQMSVLHDIKRTLLGFKDKMQDQLNKQIKQTNDKIQALNDDVDEIKEKLNKEVPTMRQELKAIKQQNFDTQNEIAQLRDLISAVGGSPGGPSGSDQLGLAHLRDRGGDQSITGSALSGTQVVDIKSKISNLNEELFEMKSSMIDIKNLLTNPKQKKKLW